MFWKRRVDAGSSLTSGPSLESSTWWPVPLLRHVSCHGLLRPLPGRWRVRVTEPAQARLCCKGPHPALRLPAPGQLTCGSPACPQKVKASTPPHCLPLPLTQHHHMLETTADKRKLGGQTAMLGVWGKKGVELGAAGSSQCDYSHARVRLLFGKIAGKTEVWYPHVSVLVQEDIGGLKWKRRWFLRAPKASWGWENFHNHRHLLSLFLSHFIPTHEF